jgi:hypothetical protein
MRLCEQINQHTSYPTGPRTCGVPLAHAQTGSESQGISSCRPRQGLLGCVLWPGYPDEAVSALIAPQVA